MEKPILFSGAMVRAILAGTKTMTRRVVKQKFTPEPARIKYWDDGMWVPESNSGKMLIDNSWQPFPSTYGTEGNCLWVRETWALKSGKLVAHNSIIQYRADDNPLVWERIWHPSIFMPRWASRITLEITGIRIERLQDISAADAGAEGVTEDNTEKECRFGMHRAVGEFAHLWDSINEKRGCGWAKNPWVWVVSFKRVNP